MDDARKRWIEALAEANEAYTSCRDKPAIHYFPPEECDELAQSLREVAAFLRSRAVNEAGEMSDILARNIPFAMCGNFPKQTARFAALGYVDLLEEYGRLLLELDSLRERNAKNRSYGFGMYHCYQEQRNEIDRLQAERDGLLSLVRCSLLPRGRCQPRSDRACAACNATDELRSIASKWNGGIVSPV